MLGETAACSRARRRVAPGPGRARRLRGWVHAGYCIEAEDRGAERGARRRARWSLGATVRVDGPTGARCRSAPGSRWTARRPPARRPARACWSRASVTPARPRRRRRRGRRRPERWALEHFEGAPYEWGGVTPWGVDCSGLVQTTFAARGISLPARRGASRSSAARRCTSMPRGRAICSSSAARPVDRITHVAFAGEADTLVHSTVALRRRGAGAVAAGQPRRRRSGTAGRGAAAGGAVTQAGYSRLVLFDIDGTILLTAGAGRRAIVAALSDEVQDPAAFAGIRFDGKTDPQIVAEMLAMAGQAEPRESERVRAPLRALRRAAGPRAGAPHRPNHRHARRRAAARAARARARRRARPSHRQPRRGRRAQAALRRHRSRPLPRRRLRLRRGPSARPSGDRRPPGRAALRASAARAGGGDHRRHAGRHRTAAPASPPARSRSPPAGTRCRELAACGPHAVFEDLADTEAVLEAILR